MKNRTRSSPYFQRRPESLACDLDMEAAAELTEKHEEGGTAEM